MSRDHEHRHALLILSAIRACAWSAPESPLRKYIEDLTDWLDLPDVAHIPDSDRRLAKYIGADENGCWPWTGATVNGYGRFRHEHKGVPAHRRVYEVLVGPVPGGLVLDHLCRNRACVNPAHLEPVTQRENIMRGEGPAAKNAAKTHCLRGHPLEGDNLRIDKHTGGRICKACQRWHMQEHRRRKRLKGVPDLPESPPPDMRPAA